MFNGNSNTGSSYDPYTANATRTIPDIRVTGAVGGYPLVWARTMNSRGNGVGTLGAGGGWRSSYDWSCEAIQGSLRSSTPIGYTVHYPDGRVVTFSNRLSPYAGPLGVADRFASGSGTQIVTLFLADGGEVQFQQRAVVGGGEYEFFIDPPTTIFDPNKLKTTLVYDGSGRLSQVTEPAGRFLKIYYNSDYTIDHVDASYPGGPITQSVTYGYNTQRFGGTNYRSLTSASYSDGTAASYTYQRANTVANGLPLISTCDDVRYPGAMKKIAYLFKSGGSYGQLYQEKHPSGALVLTLDVNGKKRTETRGDGPHRTWQYGDSAGAANLPYLLKSYSDFRNQGTLLAHDSNGFVSAMTDANNHKTLFEHNAFSGAITKITHPGDGTYRQYTYEQTGYHLEQVRDERGHLTIYRLDPTNFTRQETDYPDGGVEYFSYNGFNQVTVHTMVNYTSAGGSGGTEVFNYDSRGLLSYSYPPGTPSDPDPGPSQHPTRFGYDVNDHLQTVTDPRGNPTTFKYSERGQLLFVQHPDADQSRVTNVYNDDSTLWKTTVQFSATRSATTSYTYDDYKRVLTQTTPGDSSGTATHTTSFWYDDAGAGVTDYTHTDANVTRTVLPSGKIVTNAYDENKRLSAVTTGFGTTDAATTGFTYDPVGNLKTRTEPNYYPSGVHWTYFYDPRDRLSDVDDPSSADRNSLGHTVSYTYGPINKASEQRANDQIITYDSYDAMNRLTQMTVPQAPDPAAVTKYTWTRAGKIATMLDPNGNLYKYAYDAQNRLITSTFPVDNGGMVRTESRTYDFASNLATFTNRAGAVETFTYDQRNRETGYSWVGGSPPPPRTLVYDDASRVMRCNTPEAFIKFFYYDDNLLKSQEAWGTGDYGDGLHRTINYSYDGDGNRAGIQYPSSYTFSYSYSGRNQLQTVAQGGSGQLAVYGYDTSGNLKTRTLNNSTASTYGYDEMNRVLNISHALSGTTRTFAYGYNAVGNRTYVQRDMGMGDVFGYDKNDQMTAVLLNITNPTTTGPGGQTVYYDESGNRSYFGRKASRMSMGSTSSTNIPAGM